ncbi:MAG: mechanosensitive ion channel domain-containing protein [Thermosynechococcaceae cyanobacterium]
MDILITLAEIGAVILIAVGLNILTGMAIRAIAARWLRGKPDKLIPLRRQIRLLIQVACLALSLAILGMNGWAIYQRQSVLSFQIGLLHSIPPQYWTMLGIAMAQCMGLLLLTKLSLPWLNRLLDWTCEYTKHSDYVIANNQSIQEFFTFLKQVLANSAWILTVILCTQFLQLPPVVPTNLFIALKAYFIFSIGKLSIKAIAAIIDTLDVFSLRFSDSNNILHHYERFRHLVPALKKSLEYICYVAIAALIIQDIQFAVWLTPYTHIIIQVIGIYFLCGVLIEITNLILEDLVLKTEDLTDLQRQRRLTIIPLFKNFIKYLIYFMSGITILKLINIDPTPILAGAGIAGIAIGFGAQNLINDIVCGFFVLFENYYLVGDYVEVGKVDERNIEGLVEAIELRTTHIRHPDGQLQIIRNGEIGSVINYSKQYTYAKVDIPVPHHVDLDQIQRIVEEVGQQLQVDCPEVLEPTCIDGLENFGQQNLILRTLTRVKPGQHLNIQRLVRRQLKIACDRENIALQS